jgi:hypothetical protein
LKSFDFLRKVQDIWPGSYSEPYVSELTTYLDSITEESFDPMLQWMKHNIDNSGRVVFKKFIAAFEACGKRKKGQASKPGFERVTCECCDTSFDWNIGADSECYREYQICAFCPRCGWIYYEAQQHGRIRGLDIAKAGTESYDRRMEENRADYKKRGTVAYDLATMRSEQEGLLKAMREKAAGLVRGLA